MSDLVKLDGYICGICSHDEFMAVDFKSYIMSPKSSNLEVNDFVNYICDNCGVSTPYPQPDLDKLAKHYNSTYRKDKYTLDLDGKYVNPPVQIPWSGVSFLRFQSFFDMVKRQKEKLIGLEPTAEDYFLDYGAYQGMFLYGAKCAWGCQGIAYDYNENGIDFARNALGMENSVVAKDIYSDTFPIKTKYVSLVHVFEHLQFPGKFLAHLKQDVITDDGWLYIEVPNAFGFPMSDPTHYFSYTIDALRRTMETNGFEVEDIWIGNYPILKEYEWSTPIQNLYCLARPSDSISEKNHPQVRAQTVYNEMRKSYRALTTRYVMGELKIWAWDCARMAKHIWKLVTLDCMGIKK